MFPSTSGRQSLEFDHRETLSAVSETAKADAQQLLTSMCQGGDAVQKQVSFLYCHLAISSTLQTLQTKTIE